MTGVMALGYQTLLWVEKGTWCESLSVVTNDGRVASPRNVGLQVVKGALLHHMHQRFYAISDREIAAWMETFLALAQAAKELGE